MACSPSDDNGSTKRVCVGSCFDVDSRGRLQMKFSESMSDLFVCTDDGLCYSHEYPVCVETVDTGCGRDEGCGEGDDPQFRGAGPFMESTPGPYPSTHPEVNSETCAPTRDDAVNPIASQNSLMLTNDSCQTWCVEVQVDQFYGFIDDFEPFKAGYARVFGELIIEVDGEKLPDQPEPIRVYELARSGQGGATIDTTCTDCCDDLPETDGEDPPGNPRQECIDRVNQNAAEAEAVIRSLTFRDRMNTTGGSYRTFVDLAPGGVLNVKTQTRTTRTCEQSAANLGSRAGHISLKADPKVGCSLTGSESPCSDCNCADCA